MIKMRCGENQKSQDSFLFLVKNNFIIFLGNNVCSVQKIQTIWKNKKKRKKIPQDSTFLYNFHLHFGIYPSSPLSVYLQIYLIQALYGPRKAWECGALEFTYSLHQLLFNQFFNAANWEFLQSYESAMQMQRQAYLPTPTPFQSDCYSAHIHRNSIWKFWSCHSACLKFS